MTPSTCSSNSASIAFFLEKQPGSRKSRSLGNKLRLELRLVISGILFTSSGLCFLICKMTIPLPTSQGCLDPAYNGAWHVSVFFVLPVPFCLSSLFFCRDQHGVQDTGAFKHTYWLPFPHEKFPWNFCEGFTIFLTKKFTLRPSLNIPLPSQSQSQDQFDECFSLYYLNSERGQI